MQYSRSVRDSRAAWMFSAIGLLLLAMESNAVAQVAPDGTLGHEASQVISVDRDVEHIHAGAVRGSNVFHSFESFSVEPGRSVYFLQPASVLNIFSRVTGIEQSDINGTVGVLGDANLFFLNPNGIVFGSDAQLDIKGSFVGTTATGFEFGDGLQFAAVEPETAPLLNMSVTPGLQFGAQPQGTIVNRGRLSAGKALRLEANALNLQGELRSGGDLTLRALDELLVRDSVAEPFLAVAGDQLLMQGDRSVDIFALNHSESRLYSGGDMVLRSDNPVGGDAHYASGGNFRVERENYHSGKLYSPYDPVIRASGDVKLDSYEGASLHVIAGGSVSIPGTIEITSVETARDALSEVVTLSNDKQKVVVDGAKNPTLDIRAGVSDLAGSLTVTESLGDSNILLGSVIISSPLESGTVVLSNQYQPKDFSGQSDISIDSINVRNESKGGKVVIDSRGNVSISDFINTSGFLRGSRFIIGDAGDITILAAKNINFAQDSEVTADGVQGGNISLEADQTINFNATFLESVSVGNAGDQTGGALIMSSPKIVIENGSILGTYTFGDVNAGNVNLNVDDLELNKTGRVEAVTFGRGRSGNLTIRGFTSSNASSVYVNGSLERAAPSGLFASVGLFDRAVRRGFGDAGNLQINADVLEVSNGGRIATDVIGEGNGGNIEINAGRVKVDGYNPENNFLSGIFSAVSPLGIGNGGDIILKAESLRVADGGFISASTFGQGNGGTINIDSPQIVVTGTAPAPNSSTSTLRVNVARSRDFSGMGNAGNLVIKTQSLRLKDEGNILANTAAQGNGGSVEINSDNGVFLSRGAAINAASEPNSIGNAGKISIKSPVLELLDDSSIRTIANGDGSAGNIDLETPIDKNTLTIKVSDSQISASNNSDQTGGSILIKAQEAVNLVGDGEVFAVSRSSGDSGNVSIITRRLSMQDDIEISTSTFDEGVGGSIVLNILQDVSLRDQARLVSESLGSGRAGNIEVRTNQLSLIDSSKIGANSNSVDGGDIIIDADTALFMRGDSLINATAGQSQREGNGGNIIIDSPFLISIPAENSDIVANAFSGSGGQITINSQGVFNFDLAEGQNQAQLRQNSTNDISASSAQGPQGTITLNTPDVDPSRGLAELPTDVVDAARALAPSCTAQIAEGRGSFISTGRGGLPANPMMPLRRLGPSTAWITSEQSTATDSFLGNANAERHINLNTTTAEATPTRVGTSDIAPVRHQEASHWSTMAGGRVRLHAAANTSDALSSVQNPHCSHPPRG